MNCLGQNKIPRIGEEVVVIPTHVVGPNKLYVQLDAYSKEFHEFQFGTLQEVQLKKVTQTASKSYHFNASLILSLIGHICYLCYNSSEAWLIFGQIYRWIHIPHSFALSPK